MLYNSAGRNVKVALSMLLLATSLGTPAAKNASSLADSLQVQIGEGEFSSALKLANRLLEFQRKRADGFGSQVPDSIAYHVTDAELMVRTLDIVTKLSPTQQEQFLRSEQLTQDYENKYEQGLEDETVALIREQLATRRDLLGTEHPYVATTLRVLGIVVQAQGKYEEAEAHIREALSIYEKAVGGSHPDIAVSLVALGEVLLAKGDYQGAEDRTREALSMYETLLGSDHPDVALNLRGLARILYAKGDYPMAEAVARKALAIYRSTHVAEHRDIAASLVRVAQALQMQGKFDDAEVLFREALAMNRKLLGNEHVNVAVGLTNLADVLADQGNYADAEPLYQEGLSMLRQLLGEEHPDVAVALNNLARALQEQGDYAGAESLYREGLAMQRKLLGEHPYVATSLNNLSRALQAQGNYVAAEPLIREALAMYRRLLGNDHPYVAISQSNLAAALYFQGNYPAAEPLYREALTIFQNTLGSEHPNVAATLNSIARVLKARGDFAGAEPLIREALAMNRKLLGNSHPNVANNISNLGDVLRAKQSYSEAEVLFREALAINRSLFGNSHTTVANNLNSVANVLKERGDYASAETLYREALAINRKRLGNQHPHVASGLYNLAGVLQEQGDYESAEALLKEAAKVFSAARLRVAVGTARSRFHRSPYPRLAALRLEMGRHDEAWDAIERDLARGLAELLFTTGQRPLTEKEVAREDSLRRELGILERRVAALRSAADADTTDEASGQFERARTELLTAESVWSEFQQTIARKYPIPEGKAYTLNRIQEALSADEAIIGWLDAFSSWVYVIRHNGPVQWSRLEPPKSQPAGDLGQFRSLLLDPSTSVAAVREAARAIGTERVARFSGALSGVRHLVVIPSGRMLGVPLEVIAAETLPGLLDGIVVSYSPSATLHVWLQERGAANQTTSVRRALLVGDPPFTDRHLSAMETETEVRETVTADPMVGSPEVGTLRSVLTGDPAAVARLPRLSGTREEVAKIAKLVAENSAVLLGADASEMALVELAHSDRLREFRIIHIATHALVDNERPERSALVLSQVDLPDRLQAAMNGERIYTGFVTAKDIVGTWRLNADLVTLSGCETALGEEVGGEGYVGLSHAFFQAGARSVIVSLWKVPDQPTSLLMQRFYESYLGNGNHRPSMNKAEALRDAKLWLRDFTDGNGDQPFAHPHFWAAFILIGDPR